MEGGEQEDREGWGEDEKVMCCKGTLLAVYVCSSLVQWLHPTLYHLQ